MTPEQKIEAECICQACNKPITYDLIIDDELWKQISPKPVDGWKTGGLLCPECIVQRITKKWLEREKEYREALQLVYEWAELTGVQSLEIFRKAKQLLNK